MLQVKDSEPVRPSDSGVFAAVDDGCSVVGIERGEIVVKRVVPLNLAEGVAEVRVTGVGGGVYELLIEMLGYCGVFRASLSATVLGGERNWLVGGVFCSFTGETPDCAPESLDVCAVGDGGDERPPLGAGFRFGPGVNFCVQGADSGISRVTGSERVTLRNEALNLRAGRRGEILAVAGRDCALGRVEEDLIEGLDGGVGRRRWRKASESGFREGGEGRPVGTFEIGVCAAGPDRGGIVSEGDCDRQVVGIQSVVDQPLNLSSEVSGYQ